MEIYYLCNINTLNMGNYINPFTDVGFKRIFGQEISKPLLIDFLNSLLEDELKITDLTFLDKEQMPENDMDRSLIYDIYCEIESGEHIIVEMQNQSQAYFKDRSLFYASKAIIRQGKRGTQWEYDVKSVYLIAFLNFKLPDISDEFRTDVALMNMKSKELFSTKLRLIYLQLPLFAKEANECTTDFERGIYVLKNMETLQRFPAEFQNAVFQKLAEITDFSSLSPSEQDLYDESLKKFRDTIAVLRHAQRQGLAEGRAKGLEEGRAKGLEEGRAEGRAEGVAEGMAKGRAASLAETAMKMKQMGMDNQTIAKATGLSEEEISNL